MPRQVSVSYTGRIVLRLAQQVVDQLASLLTADYQSSSNRLLQLTELLPDLLPGLRALLLEYPDVPSREVIAPFSVPTVLGLEERARHSPFRPLHSLIGYFAMDPRERRNRYEAGLLLSRLNQLVEIDVAYWETELRDAAPVTPADEKIYPAGYHGHFDGSFRGINAIAPTVWGLYDGSNIGFVDLEAGWNLSHDDLPTPPPPVFNASAPGLGDHGTAVLGLVVGQDNGRGIVGIAPGASLRKVASHIRPGGKPWEMDKWAVTAAILDSLVSGALQPGDVLLIEVETIGPDADFGYPIEVAPEWFDAIRLAAGYGVIVIEPAGNGDVRGVARNLDLWNGEWGGQPTGRTLLPGNPDFDSGAIMVAGCVPAVTPLNKHERVDWQNFGKRVNCYAWGEDVYSAGYGDLTEGPGTQNFWYTDHFGGTSSASAIIAGAALLVQQMHEKAWGWRLSPAQLRAVLSDPLSGTRIVEATGADIGVMPDLGKIATKLGAVPDVYVRDSVGDSGVVPNASVFQSPDIIVRHTASLNPQADFGEGSPLANLVPPNDPVAPNQDNYLYVRIRNRSGVDAGGVTADLYWSEASLLVAPVHWNPIGQINAGTIPGGGALRVVGPFTWHPAPGQLPASGHGCFVAVLNQALDPRPPSLPAAVGTTTLGWNEFLTYVGANNNVAWRNFTVLSPATSPAPLAFWIRGAWDEAREFDFELVAELPAGTRIAWEVPGELAAAVEPATRGRLPDGVATQLGMRFELTGFGRLLLRRIRLERRADHRCLLHLRLPPAPVTGEGLVTIRQIYQRTTVGQMTWSIGP